MNIVFELNSTCGNHNLLITAYDELKIEKEKLYLCNIEIKRVFWDRKESIEHGYVGCNLANNYTLLFYQVAIDKNKLIYLLENLNSDESLFEPVELCWQDGSESFKVSKVKKYPDTIVEIGKHVWVCNYHKSSINIDANFKIDQSCIRLARESLETFLKQP